jgi:hypothetical protein
MGVEALLINFSPPVHPSSQTHDRLASCWHHFCPTSPPPIQPSIQTHVWFAICWHCFHPIFFPSDYPTVHPNLCSQLTKPRFLLFYFLFWHYGFYFIRLQRLFCTSVVSNISHMIIHLQWKMESLYQGLPDMIFQKKVQASSLKIWKRKLFNFFLV